MTTKTEVRSTPRWAGGQAMVQGTRIYLEDTELPGYKLPSDEVLSLSPEFRAQFEDWSYDFFSRTKLVPDGKIMSSYGGVIMNSSTFQRIKFDLYCRTIPHGTSEEKAEFMRQLLGSKK